MNLKLEEIKYSRPAHVSILSYENISSKLINKLEKDLIELSKTYANSNQVIMMDIAQRVQVS